MFPSCLASNEKSLFPYIKLIFSHGSCDSFEFAAPSGTFGGSNMMAQKGCVEMTKAAAGRYETTSLRHPPPRGRNRCHELKNTATTVAAANCCARRYPQFSEEETLSSQNKKL
ncbi:hypothetical protein Tco_1017772 [Tanacetum coccineum]|uniref:Uncharacterized protein n=1 Tax=Tanacetum coccineum TaxID=301880 RepID=A0ABQ5FV04_9ASTR